MTREGAEAKGRRYIVEGRLTVHSVTPTGVTATCKGSGTSYTVTQGRGGWSCSCEARGRCSHLVALMLVVDRPGSRST